MAGTRTHILLQVDLVRQRFWQPPFAKKWRLSWQMPPLRGWIWQQIVKLSIAEAIEAEANMLVDYDCLFLQTFSEYVLYGIFVEHVLGIEASGHYIFDRELVENYCPEKPMDEQTLQEFQRGIDPEKVMVHINRKSRTPVALISQRFLPNLPSVELS